MRILFQFLAFASLLFSVSAVAEPVRFVVFGDLQEETAAGHAKDLALADRINSFAPEFSVFIGDIKGGGQCDGTHRQEAAEIFARMTGPVVYTPGDNEWTDCTLPGWGGFDPIERLEKLREDLVPDGVSLGQNPMPLAQQSGPTRENARWRRGDVLFVTLSMPGSNNGLWPYRYAFEEYEQRNAANLAWLSEAFEIVQAENLKVLVVLFHANPLWDESFTRPSAYRDFKDLLDDEGRALDVPILAVHGDTHTFRIDKPLRFKNRRSRADHVTRLEVFGPPKRGFVIVTINPDADSPFLFEPIEGEAYDPS